MESAQQGRDEVPATVEHATEPRATEQTNEPASAPAASAPGRSFRGAVVGWVAGAVVLVAVALTAGLLHYTANRGYDTAEVRLGMATDAAAEAHDSLEDSATVASAYVASADEIVGDASDALVDVAARDALAEASETAATSGEEAAALIATGVDDGRSEKPLWTWELWEATSELEQRTDDALAAMDDLGAVEAGLAADLDAVHEAAGAVFASVPAAAEALEADNVSAKTGAVLDFRDAAADVADETEASADASLAFSTYASRAEVLADSNQAELAEKAGPLRQTRLEIEEYARSISGGVLLDFDWALIVNGIGGAAGIGGTATWNSDRGGFSTISLSNSVAEWWPNADSRALVTHEVGHAISAKCYDKFDWEDADANEEWATAWAISMGHTAEGNGVQAYGYPSQEMIEIAGTCR